MTATFLLPFAMGACEAVGGNIGTDAFGVVAMVAMTPLIAIQILGVVYAVKLKRAKKQADVAEAAAAEAATVAVPGKEKLPVGATERFHHQERDFANEDIIDF